MNCVPRKSCTIAAPALLALAIIVTASSTGLLAQVWPPGPASTADDQRNMLKLVRVEVGWLQNATRTAPNYATGGYGLVREQFEKVRVVYDTFKRTLTPRQLESGANNLAELDAGLDIIQEAFAAFEADVANGRAAGPALRSMCQVVGRASALWLQELNRDSSRLRVGFP